MSFPGLSANPPNEDLRTWRAIEAFSDLLTEAADLEHACSIALQFALDTIGRSTGLLFVQTPAETGPFLLVRRNLPEDWVGQLANPGSELLRLMGTVLQDGSYTQGEIATEAADEFPALGAIVPITVKSHPQGALLIHGEACSREEIEWLTALARPVGRAISTGRSNLTVRKHAKELAALQIVVTQLGLNTEFVEMQAQMIRGVCRVLDAETGALVLLDEDQGGLVTKKTLGPNSEWVYQVNLKDGDGLLKECLNRGQAFWVNDIGIDPRFNPAYDAAPGLEVRSMLCAPLMANGHVIGAIQVLNKGAGGFDAYDQDLLTMISNLAAQAIYGARLIQQLKVANADLEASHWELLRSRNTLRALFDSMPAALYIVDRKHKLISINLFCSARTGKPPKALVGRQCYEALYGRDGACPGCRVSETLFNGGSTSRTERRWGVEEEPTEWEVSTYPILDESEKVVQCILLEQDVTEKRRLESIIAQSEKLAAVGQLAAGVAHEINNPLTAIMANAQILQRELPPDDDLQESIDLITRAGARATQVVRNLLDFARKEQYHLALTDINDTIQRSLGLVQHELLSRSIRLEFEPSQNLPEILASHDHLQGVWLNLLLNAVDSINGPEGVLRVTTRKVGNDVRVSVSDNGNGIPPEKISRIFEPFYTTKSPGRGTGLGLSVCHRVIKQHGGHILVDSQVGKGTEFTVVLPVS